MNRAASVTSKVEVVEPYPAREGRDLYRAVAAAIAARQSLKIRFHPHAGQKFAARELAVIESNLERLLGAALTVAGFGDIADTLSFRLNLESFRQLDGDGDWLDVVIPFDTIVPPGGGR